MGSRETTLPTSTRGALADPLSSIMQPASSSAAHQPVRMDMHIYPQAESRGEVVAKVRGLLLCSPDPERWRRTLHDLLLDYVMEQAKRDAITFVLNMIIDARSLKLCQPNQQHCIHIDAENRPSVFPVERWRHLMIALGFMLEEPDTNSDIRLCSVFVHQMMPLPLLTGVITLLKCFLALNCFLTRWLLGLRPEEAQCLMEAIVACDGQRLQPLWDYHRDPLEMLGFRRVLHRQHVHYVHSSGLSLSHLLPQVYAVLFAMYGSATDIVQETLV